MVKETTNKLLVTALWTVYFFILFAIQFFSHWWILRVSGLHNGVTFMDLRGVLLPLDCYRSIGISIYDTTSNECGVYIYGSTLAALINFFGITPSQTSFWAISFIVIFCLTLGLLSSFFTTQSNTNPIIICVVLSSPGLLFLIERTNIDLIMFFLVFAACLLDLKGFSFWAILLIALATLIKFYTAPLLIAMILMSKSRKIRLFAIAVCLIVIPTIISDYFKLKDIPQGWFVSFGANYIGHYVNTFTKKFNLDLPTIELTFMYISGLIVFVLNVLLVSKFSEFHKNGLSSAFTNKIGKEYSEKVLLFFGSVFLSAYLFGMSYDFRLIFAAVSGLALMSLTPAGVLQKLTQGSLIIGLWSTFSFGVQIYPTISIAPSFVLIQFIGDLALGIFSAFLALKLIKLYRNQLFSQQNNQD